MIGHVHAVSPCQLGNKMPAGTRSQEGQVGTAGHVRRRLILSSVPKPVAVLTEYSDLNDVVIIVPFCLLDRSLPAQ